MSKARFLAAYTPALAALYAAPDYRGPLKPADAAAVAEKLVNAAEGANWGRGNTAQVAACKALGIPCTRTAILNYLALPEPV